MKALLLVTALNLLTILNVVGQAVATDSGGMLYLFPNETREGSGFRRGVFPEDHVLGDSITAKFNEFEKRYIYYKPGNGAYAVEEKIILKPSIYKSVKKFDTYIQKEFDKQTVSKGQAAKRLSNLLDISLKLVNYQTESVEKEIKKMKTPEQIEAYLLSLKFNPRIDSSQKP